MRQSKVKAREEQQGGAGVPFTEHAYVWPASSPFAFEGWKDSDQAKPWVELLEDGEFSESTLAKSYPPSYQISKVWMDELRRAKPTWLGSLYLGIGSMEMAGGQAQQQPDFTEGRAYFKESFHLKKNPIAARCLAVSAPTPLEAASNFSTAWDLAVTASASALPSSPSSSLKPSGLMETLLIALASEICSFYLEEGYGKHLDAFLAKVDAAAVSGGVKTSETVLFAKATRAMQKKDCKTMRSIIASSRFPTFFDTARTQLASLWLTCAVIDEEIKLGHSLNSVERHRVRVSSAGDVSPNIGPFKGKILPH